MANGLWLIANGSPAQILRSSSQARKHILRSSTSVSIEIPIIRADQSLLWPARMESRIISERAFSFGCRIIKLCEILWKRGPAARKVADQLFDSGTSMGANTAESQGGQTKPDFIAKLSIARKESWESIFWLKIAIASSIATKEEVAWELNEAQQLKAMITQAIKTAQSSPWRGGPT